MTAVPDPPAAPRRPHTHSEHGVARSDPYFWLGDADDPDVLAHLTAERAFYDASSVHLEPLTSALRAQMLSRLPGTDESARWVRKRFTYWTRNHANSEYAELWRLNHGSTAGSTTESESSRVLNIASLDAGTGYLDVGVTLVSPDEDLLAYSVDTSGDEVFELRFRDLRTGEDLADRVPRSYFGGPGARTRARSSTPSTTTRTARSRCGGIGWAATPRDDVLVLEEPDEMFSVNVRATRSGELIVIWSESRSTSEAWVLDAADPGSPPRSVGGRRHGVVYRVEQPRRRRPVAGRHQRRRGRVPDDDGPGPPRRRSGPHRVDRSASRGPERASDAGRRVRGRVVLSYRAEHEHRLRVLAHDDLAGAGRVLASRYEVGCLELARNTSYDAATVTVRDESYLRPPVWSSVDLLSGTTTEVQRGQAPGFDPEQYVVERRTFPAPDGTGVPAVLVRHRETALDGTAPCVIYAYGAYEAVDEPAWDAALPSVLDRGVVWVHALVRGGGEGGRRWWLDGSMRHKQHTFDDLIAVADGLDRDGLVDSARIATRGLSAGGLLQGVVFSQRPDRWRAVVAEVPFVDVVTTMFDEATPLTITEWEEWGDPRIREQFDWMLAYSPYDNLPPAGGRPDLLVTGAVHDPRVMVREPAKWVAALRHSDPEWSARCLFRCETGAGAHVGPSGRVAHLGYEAEIYAWILDRLGVEANT